LFFADRASSCSRTSTSTLLDTQTHPGPDLPPQLLHYYESNRLLVTTFVKRKGVATGKAGISEFSLQKGDAEFRLGGSTLPFPFLSINNTVNRSHLLTLTAFKNEADDV